MDRISHIVEDTVTIEITVDNLSTTFDSPVLKLFLTKNRQGFNKLIKTLDPVKQIDNKFIFMYNTEDFVKHPLTYYGHFSINNNGVFLNNFYKIKATY